MASYDDTATVSGSVVSIENGADEVGAKSCVVTVRPTLAGTSEVVEKQTGRNLFDKTAVTDNTWIVVNDTTTESAVGYRTSDYLPVKANTRYYVSGKSSNRAAYYDRNKNGIAYFSFSGGASFNSLYDGYIRLTIKNDIDLDTFIVNEGNTAITYEPYSGTTYSANLGQTVHGAEVDLVSGTGKNTGAIHTITSENVNEISRLDGHRWYIHNRYIHCITPSTDDADSVVCDKLKSQTGGSVYDNRCFINANGAIRINTTSEYATNSDFLEDFGGSITFAFILDPSYYTDITFDGQEIPTRKGYNAFWSEQGDTELTYYKDGYGFTSVTVNKTGKNLLENNIEDGSTGGISYSKNADGSISCVGTASNVNATRLINTVTLPIGNYILSGADSSINLRAVLYDGTGTAVTNRNDTGNGVTISVDSTIAYIEFRIKARTASEVVNTIISPMLAVGSSVLPYEPYEAVSKTAYLHKVIYGGQADVVKGTCEPKNLLKNTLASTTVNGTTFTVNNGVITISGTPSTQTRVYIKQGVAYTVDVASYFSSGTMPTGTRIFSKKVSDGTTTYPTLSPTSSLNTVGAVYSDILLEINTTYDGTEFSIYPQIEHGSSASEYAPHFEPFSFPPISMETDEGENTLFANEGASAITYRKETD